MEGREEADRLMADKDSAIDRGKRQAHQKDRKDRHYDALKRLRFINKREKPPK